MPCPRAARRASILNGWSNTTATTTLTPVSRQCSSSSWTARPRSSAIMMWTASISTTTSIPARYGADFNSIDDWRRDNVNTLIASLDETLHTLDPELSFGVSPAGIWANKSENSRGSDTHGQSSYSELYCDSLEWIRRGTVDYICPQLYWAIGYKAADFETLVRWWQKAVSTSDVALYIGLGAYRSAEAQEGDVWYGTAELERQLALLDDSIDIQGEVYFSYASLERVAGCPAMLTAHYKAKDAGHPAPPSTNEPDGCTQQQVTLLNMLSTLIASLFA